MKLKKAKVFVPKTGKPGKVKYLTICAHQGDNEIMAIDGIMRGYRARKYSFACAVTTKGEEAPRTNKTAKFNNNLFIGIRNKEQRKAAELGRYNSLYFLNYSGEEARDQENEDLINDYVELIKELKPRIVYTHSIFDKHPTNVSVAVKVIFAIRRLPKKDRPQVVYGCEVWGDLDWVDSKRLVFFNNSKNIRLQKQLINVYRSQIDGGKAYTNAAIGRRYANATFVNAKENDTKKLCTRAMVLTPLIRNVELPIKKYAMTFAEDLYFGIQDSMDRSL